MNLHRFRWGYTLVMMVMSLVQVGLGTDIVVVSFLTCSAIIGIAPLNRHKIEIADIIFFAFLLYNAAFTLIIKTLLMQPLDSNLSSPSQSSTILLIGLTSALMGYLAQRRLIKIKDIFGFSIYFNNLIVIKKLVLPTAIIGLLLTVLQSLFGSQKVDARIEGGIGFFGSIAFILPLSITFIVALISLKETKPKAEKLLFFVISSSIILSVLLNAKAPLFQSALTVIIASISISQVKFKPKVILGGAIISLVSLFYLIPLIQITRPLVGDIAAFERVKVGWDILENSKFNPIEINIMQSELVERGSEFSQNGSYVFPSTLNVDRFMLILPLDQIVRTSLPPMGLKPIIDEIIEIIPGPFVNKTQIAAADQISWYYGFRTNGYVSRPVVGLLPSCYGLFGIIGVVFIPFFAIFFTLSIISITSGHFNNRIWGAFITSVSIPIAEKDISGIITWNIRGLATIIIVAFIIKFIFSVLFRPLNKVKLGHLRLSQ